MAAMDGVASGVPLEPPASKLAVAAGVKAAEALARAEAEVLCVGRPLRLTEGEGVRGSDSGADAVASELGSGELVIEAERVARLVRRAERDTEEGGEALREVGGERLTDKVRVAAREPVGEGVCRADALPDPDCDELPQAVGEGRTVEDASEECVAGAEASAVELPVPVAVPG